MRGSKNLFFHLLLHPEEFVAFPAVGANGLDAVLDARRVSAVGGHRQNLGRGGQVAGGLGESALVIPDLARRPGDAAHGSVPEGAPDFSRVLGDVLGRPLDLAHGPDSAAGLGGDFDVLQTAGYAAHDLFPGSYFRVLVSEHLA